MGRFAEREDGQGDRKGANVGLSPQREDLSASDEGGTHPMGIMAPWAQMKTIVLFACLYRDN